MKQTGSDTLSSIVVETVTKLVEPIVSELHLELVEVQFRREAVGWVLRLIIDGDAGVTLDKCATVSREVSSLLEVEDPIEQAYNLEVSSPGLDRPLKKEKDFIRFKGSKAKVTTSEPIERRKHFDGVIEDFDQNMLSLATDQGLLEIPYDQIAKARLIIDF